MQDFNAFCSYMNQYPRDKFLEAVSDFHVLVYLATCDMLPVGVSTRTKCRNKLTHVLNYISNQIGLVEVWISLTFSTFVNISGMYRDTLRCCEE